ncbi:hypothetical protein MLD38_039480 [Melastoma candidum]|uniref:Uncharacterized protein n=1 Tax=Melastoma candidum TaxID=119954 RepID=A0ACB9L3L7_9MYRT|nr:hypothetical protein MLD38_039480 [Melastoma candidum]
MSGRPPQLTRPGGHRHPPPPQRSQPSQPPAQPSRQPSTRLRPGNPYTSQNPYSAYVQGLYYAGYYPLGYHSSTQALQSLAPLSQFQNPNFSLPNPVVPSTASVNPSYNQPSTPPTRQKNLPAPNTSHKPPPVGVKLTPPGVQQQRPSSTPNNSNVGLLEKRAGRAVTEQKEPAVIVGETVNLQKVLESVIRPQKKTLGSIPDSSLASGSQSQPFLLSLLPNRNGSLLEKIDRAAMKARRDLVIARENVTVQKVSEAVLLEMHANSWSDLGFQIHDVPSLNGLMANEAKINSFIHCFVGARFISTVYELEVAIRKNEAVKKFEDLEMGPLMRHQLVLHYFSVEPGATDALKLTTENIVYYLIEYLGEDVEKEVLVEDFLEYIMKRKSVSSKEKLAVRIQNLGLHVAFIKEARRLEVVGLQEFSVKEKNVRKRRPLLSFLKKQTDGRFAELSERVKSFSDMHKKFCGKHVRFASSSSDEESDACEVEDKLKSFDKPSAQSYRSERFSSCPYPSASEEMSRLGLVDGEMHSPLSTSGFDQSAPKKKRKADNSSGNSSTSKKLPRTEKLGMNSVLSGVRDIEEDDISLLFHEDHLRIALLRFISTWKETCREQNLLEIFKRMLQAYELTTKESRKISRILSRNPFLGLLNVAVTSIRNGMWDNVYDTLQAIGSNESNKAVTDGQPPQYETIDVLPSQKNAVHAATLGREESRGFSIDDVISKATTYFQSFEGQVGDKCLPDRQYHIFKEIYRCERWLAEQFSVENFESLGHGNFFSLLELHSSHFPNEVQKLFTKQIGERDSFGVLLSHHQLLALVSQASNSLKEYEEIEERDISALVRKQYPSLDFKVEGVGLIKDFLKIHQSCMSSCVLFSASMSYRGDYVTCDSQVGDAKNIPEVVNNWELRACGQSSRKEAIEVLLKAPMLSDLLAWSLWETKFAPTLGHLVNFLLSEVNSGELLCLVTKNGKIIRINHSASVETYLEALLKVSPVLTALELTSLFSLVGGEKYVPLSLLKSHTQRAFEATWADPLDCVNNTGSVDLTNKIAFREKHLGDVCDCKSKINMFRFFLDCLAHVPAEYGGFAADVLFAGLRSFAKDAPARILKECNGLQERTMLQNAGVSLGLEEWAENLNAFTVADVVGTEVSRTPTIQEPVTASIRSDILMKDSSEAGVAISDENCSLEVKSTPISESNDEGANCVRQYSAEGDCADPMLLIESIRRDEFGLDLDLSVTESSMLRKQHARLGRALHCLSQELYSQDSHFLLELVQNADDNAYPDHVEPTLSFILHESGVVILNNEKGFSAENIRALCDIGSSTKKGSSAGYIGQKGIGFKSVFRVTNAPEIHSNGFHLKFDITEGQIGFVLPTPIPPCDINMFARLVSYDTNKRENNCWNTCIRLPLRSKLSSGTAINSIIAMFSDLHPSLLLFLHRLQCIRFRNMLNDSFIIMRKDILGHGIVKVSYGKDGATWLVVSQKLQSDFIRNDVQLTEISMAFPLDEATQGSYSPRLEPQPVFAFLPLRAYGLRFIIQGDFALPSSREEVDSSSPWNQWLLSQLPDLFVGAKDSFCNLPCFQENPASAVSAYMSFIPLIGEVHGFFSGLPKMIILRLRMSSCLLLDRDQSDWIPPCKALRGWDKLARIVLTDELLEEHLGVGFLHRDIVLSDQLASALGVEDYSLKILLRIMSSLNVRENGFKSMGLSWLSEYINVLYIMLQNSDHVSGTSEIERNAMKDLQKIAFIPLSDGSYSSLDKGVIWLHANASNTDFYGENGLKAYPIICTNLRIIDSALFSAASSDMLSMVNDLSDNIRKMLQKVGVRELSAHDILLTHVLPALSDNKNLVDRTLVIEYLCFVMVHLQSGCPSCLVEREYIMSTLRSRCFILTDHGFKFIMEVPIHFSEEYGCPVNAKKLISGLRMEWHMVDPSYLRHPSSQSLSCGPEKWRKFFQELGITDFVQVLPMEKSLDDVPDINDRQLLANGDVDASSIVVKDWESTELAYLLPLLSNSCCHENCKYLLKMLDKLWESDFSDKVFACCQPQSQGNGTSIRSSFVKTLRNARWVMSALDNDLHYPKDLFHDCDKVRMILGAYAPYAVPKVTSERLLHELGFKTTVCLNDVLVMLKLWGKSDLTFKASLAQMTRLYTFIWEEMASLPRRVVPELRGEKFVFYPTVFKCRSEDMVDGEFCSLDEVCWHDPTGAVEQIYELYSQRRIEDSPNYPAIKTLQNVYPGLHDFFVTGCGVLEVPPSHSYFPVLLQLSSTFLPSQAAKIVFQIFLKMNMGIESGAIQSSDILEVRNCLMKQEYAVLPTKQDKWVSLHPSFGIVCWCDDGNLMKEFRLLEGVNFVCFGQVINCEATRLNNSKIMQKLGIPALSEVASREAIFHGTLQSSFEASLVDWALPYAQRYIYTMHSENYQELKQCCYRILKNLRVLVVEKLFYRNVIKSCNSISSKQHECSCILQGNALYVAKGSDTHAWFLELSRVWFDGNQDLHTANFLHMITVMARSGSSMEQIETFIMSSQKLKKLPDGDPEWALSTVRQYVESFQAASSSSFSLDANSVEFKSSSQNSPQLPSGEQNTSSEFYFNEDSSFMTWIAMRQPEHGYDDKVEARNETAALTDNVGGLDTVSWVRSDPASLPTSSNVETMPNEPFSLVDFLSLDGHSVDLSLPDGGHPKNPSQFRWKEKLNNGISNPVQAQLTGRLGELVAFKYFMDKVSDKTVRWVNEHKETGLPYDLVIGDSEDDRQYIEVKATRSNRKDWFLISTKEWQFAVEKGELFSVAHVVLLENSEARVSILKNPLRLCQMGKLQLLMHFPLAVTGNNLSALLAMKLPGSISSGRRNSFDTAGALNLCSHSLVPSTGAIPLLGSASVGRDVWFSSSPVPSQVLWLYPDTTPMNMGPGLL